jgi:hypothetical protein
VLIVSLIAASPVVAQDVNRTQIQQLTKIEPATTKLPQSSVRPSYLLPPQGQTDTGTTKPVSGTSHKKRNIIIAVVVAAAVGCYRCRTQWCLWFIGFRILDRHGTGRANRGSGRRAPEFALQQVNLALAT